MVGKKIYPGTGIDGYELHVTTENLSAPLNGYVHAEVILHGELSAMRDLVDAYEKPFVPCGWCGQFKARRLPCAKCGAPENL